ncbi:MAG TPA: penicillin-binding protein 2 [Acidimicrobiales bacterium]|nr:penicillin-binding protein 2 [Acidimicrobiales bacterium]
MTNNSLNTKNKKVFNLQLRVVTTGVLFFSVAAWFVWRLIGLQILDDGQRYSDYAKNKRIDQIVLPAGRGAIVDRNNVDLVLSVPAKTITADPSSIEDPLKAAKELSLILDMELKVLEERLLQNHRQFTYLQRQVEDDVAEEVTKLGIKGVFVIEEMSRVRPGEELALNLLGRTDIDGNGISGIEKAYDTFLTGSAGLMQVETGAGGLTIPGGSNETISLSENGHTLVLTIDRSVQFAAERILIDGVVAANAQGGTLVAMRPDTGEIVASATVSRDADGSVGVSSDNRAVTWAYEPGSIMKPLTFAGVLQENVGAPSSVKEIPNAIEIWDKVFIDSFAHEAEEWSIAEILKRSSNVGTIIWAQELGEKHLYESLANFGLGQISGLELPGETRGSLLEQSKWSGTSLSTIAIGQGIAATPLQMLVAYSTIANGGLKPAPTLVLGARDSNGAFEMMNSKSPEQVFSNETSDLLIEMMEGVVTDGTGTRAQVPGYQVAGKTGTAWKPHPEGGYGQEINEIRYVASFAGFLPSDDPELAIIVVIDEPVGSTYSGGKAAAPVFAEFAQFAVRQLRIPSEAERLGLEQAGRVIATTPAQAREIAEAEAEAAALLEAALEEVAAPSSG